MPSCPPHVVIHLPHASTALPILSGYVRDPRPEMDLLTDWHTDRIFGHDGPPFLPAADMTVVQAPFSRVCCDVERYADDAIEPMASLGMGMAYTLTDEGIPLRHLIPSLRARILKELYLPHHQRLDDAVASAGAQDGGQGMVLLIDGHSFTNLPLRRDPDQSLPRPDLCLGTDPRWTDPRVVEAVRAWALELGLQVAVNRPYGGTMVPRCVTDVPAVWTGRFQSLMIEWNRRLYLDGTMATPAVERLRAWTGELIAVARAEMGRSDDCISGRC